MRPVDRVLNCIKRKSIDRVPRNFTAFPEIVERLKSHFSIEGDQSYGSPLIKCVDPRLLEALSCDFRMVAPEYHGPEIKKEADGSWTNLFGVKRKVVKVKTGMYYSYEGTPLKNATARDVKNYPWPRPEWFDYSTIEKQCQRFADFAIVSGYPGNVDFLNKTTTLMGMENLMMGLARKDAAVLEIFDKLAEFFYEYNRRIFEIGKEKLTFHGGICVQKILPEATPGEVKKEVDKVISILGKGGGYVLCPTNKIGPEVPLENVLAMYGQEYGDRQERCASNSSRNT